MSRTLEDLPLVGSPTKRLARNCAGSVSASGSPESFQQTRQKAAFSVYLNGSPERYELKFQLSFTLIYIQQSQPIRSQVTKHLSQLAIPHPQQSYHQKWTPSHASTDVTPTRALPAPPTPRTLPQPPATSQPTVQTRRTTSQCLLPLTQPQTTLPP